MAEALGEDPGARLDRPDRILTMLKVFGLTRRLADLCLKHPVAAADTLIEGPSSVLAEAARDLSALSGGVGGAEALYGALAPLKSRADIAIGLAELSGVWTAREATGARADFAERLVETALAWLLRAAVNRGELAAEADAPGAGVFALAGGDFAHEDLAPYGPMELAVIYDEKRFTGPAARMAERAFVRVGAELREAFEGKPGDYPIFTLKTPFGSGVSGAGLVESQSRAVTTLSAPPQGALRAWLATARVVAGDRRAGGVFLESVEETAWRGLNGLDEEKRALLRRQSDDPRSAFRAIADLFRWSFGAARPVFRAASADQVFDLAAKSGALASDVANRLRAGNEFAHFYVSRAQMMRGCAAFGPAREDEEEALAALCGYDGASGLRAVVGGFAADARNTLDRLLAAPLSEFERYRAASENPGDADKLEDLGFRDGARLASVIDQWTALAGVEAGAGRFAALAPGLLTAFGETQRPDGAVRLFDTVIRAAFDKADQVLARFNAQDALRDGLVTAFGCFDAAVAPLTETERGVEIFFEERGAETPRNGAEWLSRFAPPPSGAPVEEIAAWRRESIARIALYAACGDMSFDAAASALEATGWEALARVFETTCKDDKTGEHLALHVFDGPARGLPGAPALFGFIADGGDPEEREKLARAFLEAVDSLGEGFFAVLPDVSHRPGGAAGPLAPDAAAFKSFVQSEAVAYDQILLSRGRVIAGADKARKTAKAALRTAVSNPRRADVLFRDLDRARAQRLRRDRAASEWDIEQTEGGLHDVELIISTLIYRHAAAQPAIQEGGADHALDVLARAGLVQQSVAETLKSARAFWTRLATARALAQWSDPQREPARPRFAALLARAAEVERFAQVRPIMRGYAEEATRLYTQLVLGRPSLSLVANA
ncbi:[protein-PII] uridylyltransferase family protein [Amphiplicatus metriothermophilus]|uniref:[protein-PII] uridylyltransferase family protein n=1 Tax=Amphiplicatus metriothermophilus TaxID=1519374 RepID=UPI000B7959A1|nr:hypothetical protein [Amphiplicatus metriothermophilus]MBB5518348.1 glutamate-ammonia-ligase adenylyltransferase [Amphiplicatus metriothermophilus]